MRTGQELSEEASINTEKVGVCGHISVDQKSISIIESGLIDLFSGGWSRELQFSMDKDTVDHSRLDFDLYCVFAFHGAYCAEAHRTAQAKTL